MSSQAAWKRPPVYFLSIGGPNFIENTEHPAYGKLAEVGREITHQIKPKAVIVISAHWQAGPSTIKINVAEKADIIYDFYGFPPQYYEIQYPNEGSPDLAKKIVKSLKTAGIEIEEVKRGLDHGVWVGFLAAFDPKRNPLGVPIVQISLFDSDDGDQHYRLGQALESFRDEGVLIIGAGMAAHNLQDFRVMRMSGRVETKPYTSSFDDALEEAVSLTEGRHTKLADLLKRPDARRAHPTFEHILPMHVVAGAAGSDAGHRLWTYPEGSLNWAQYRFG